MTIKRLGRPENLGFRMGFFGSESDVVTSLQTLSGNKVFEDVGLEMRAFETFS